MSGYNNPYNTPSNFAQNNSGFPSQNNTTFSPQNNLTFTPQNNQMFSPPQNNSLSAPSQGSLSQAPAKRSKIWEACDAASYFLGSVEAKPSMVVPLQNRGQSYEASNGRFQAACGNCWKSAGGNFLMIESSDSSRGHVQMAGQCKGNCKNPVNFEFKWGNPGSQGRLQ